MNLKFPAICIVMIMLLGTMITPTFSSSKTSDESKTYEQINQSLSILQQLKAIREEFKQLCLGLRSIAYGDCVDLHYIIRYASNNTVIDSSYDDIENKSDGTPLHIFVSSDPTTDPPSGFEDYSSNIIEGLMEGIIGKKQGRTHTIGPILPEKAYGENKLSIGSSFNSSTFAINSKKPHLSLTQTLQVTGITNDFLDLKWIDIEDIDMFTMPEIIVGNLSSNVQHEMIIIPPPYFIWENASEIISIHDESVSVLTTPNKLNNIVETIEMFNYGLGQDDIFFLFPDATTITYNDERIEIHSNPIEGDIYLYEVSYFGGTITVIYEIEDVYPHSFNISWRTDISDEKTYQIVSNEQIFNRVYEMTRVYADIPMIYAESLIGDDLQKQGYSLHPLAGEELLIEIDVIKIYKTSLPFIFRFLSFFQ